MRVRSEEASSGGPGSAIQIREVHGPEEYPRLVEIWRSAVDATHHFLADEHREKIEVQLPANYLPQVDVYVADLKGVPVGFAGVSGQKLEMLFVDAQQRRRGIGSALMSFVRTNCGVTAVDVNQQNTQAVEFYLRQGFTVASRSDLDGQGWPYPVLHLMSSNE